MGAPAACFLVGESLCDGVNLGAPGRYIQRNMARDGAGRMGLVGAIQGRAVRRRGTGDACGDESARPDGLACAADCGSARCAGGALGGEAAPGSSGADGVWREGGVPAGAGPGGPVGAGGGGADLRSDEDATARGLLARVARGDEGALEALYARYARPVLAFVTARCPDRGLAEEVAADVWLGCWRSARAFRGDSRVLTWLLGIARRQLYVHVRGARMVVEPLGDGVEELTAGFVAGDGAAGGLPDEGLGLGAGAGLDGLGSAPGPGELGNPELLLLEATGVEELRAALGDLPADLREVVTMAWLHELPYEEISQVVGVPVGTVKSRVFRARRLLRERLAGSREGCRED